MPKYVVETFYTCTFKIVHKIDELNEKKLSELENRNDGEVQIIDVKLNNRKTKKVSNKNNFEDYYLIGHGVSWFYKIKLIDAYGNSNTSNMIIGNSHP